MNNSHFKYKFSVIQLKISFFYDFKAYHIVDDSTRFGIQADNHPFRLPCCTIYEQTHLRAP